MKCTMFVAMAWIASLMFQLQATAQLLEEELAGEESGDPWLSETFREFAAYHHRHHHGHHHRHGHRHHAFRGLRNPPFHHHRAVLAMTAPAVVKPGKVKVSEHLLAPRHPAVDQQLKYMPKEIEQLSASKDAAKEARGHLEGMVNDVALHMNDALEIKHEITKKEAKIEADKNKLERLEESEQRMETTHDKLLGSLHAIMDPKIKLAEARAEKQEATLAKEREFVENWQEKYDSYKSSALQLLEDRKVAKEGLEEAEEQFAQAQRDVENAEKNLRVTSAKTDQEVETYRYVESKFMAARSKENAGEQEAKNDEVSEEKLKGIMNMEQNRIDKAMAVGRDKLQGKIRKVETLSSKDNQELESLEAQYNAWRKTQNGRVEEVVQAKATTEQLADDFRQQQEKVVAAASDKVVKQAMDDSDWAWGDEPMDQPDQSVEFNS